MHKYTITFEDALQKARFVRDHHPVFIRQKYSGGDVVVRTPKREVRSPYAKKPWEYYKEYGLEHIYIVWTEQPLVNPECLSFALDWQREPNWQPINVQQLTTTTNYGTYELIYGSGYDTVPTGSIIQGSGYLLGPWYLNSSYCNMYNAWDVTQGSGIVITAQEQFDYTHIGYFVTPTGATNSGWMLGNYTNEYAIISGGTHPVFSDYTFASGSNLGASGSLGVCYWYSGGVGSYPVTGYGCIHAFNAGDSSLVPVTSGAFHSPRTCYTANFNPTTGNCRNGEYRTTWIGSLTPSSFAPHSHGDGVTSVFGGRARPTLTITSFANAIGNIGSAPECTILIGSNGADYNIRESVLGADVRVYAFDGVVSQTDSDLARSYGTILVQGVGGNINVDWTHLSGWIPPHNSVQIGAARPLGSKYNLLVSSLSDLTPTGNYGIYAGRGRSNYIDFAAPSEGVWMNNVRYNEDFWGPWSITRSGSSYATAFAAGVLGLMAARNTGWSWEDIVTAVCQTAKKYEVRMIPHGDSFGGQTTFSGNTSYAGTQNKEFINISGNQGAADSVNWFYAYPSGNSIDIYNNAYSVIQIGNDPSDELYELMYYFDKSTTDNTISGKSTQYGAGQMLEVIRGWGGTIPKQHIVAWDSVMYAPIFQVSGDWNPMIGWGLVDAGAALDVRKENLSILPPKQFTTTLLASSVQFTFYPFRSSNWGGVTVVKNNDHPPRNYADGLEVFNITNTGYTHVTGYDTGITSGTVYYGAFQYDNKLKGRTYSVAVPYAQSSVNITSWGVTILKEDTFFGVRVPQPQSTQTTRISGYRVFVTTGSTFTGAPYIETRSRTFNVGQNKTSAFTDLASSTTISLDTGSDYNVLIQSMPLSFNLLKNSDFKTFSYTGWDYWRATGTGLLSQAIYSITPDMEYKFGRFSVSMRDTGATYVDRGIGYSEFVQLGDSQPSVLTAYIKTTGYSTAIKLKLRCFTSGYVLSDTLSRSLTVSSTDWVRVTGVFLPAASGGSYAVPTGTAYVQPSIEYVSDVDIRLWVANVQYESGYTAHDYSQYTFEVPVQQISGFIDSLGPPDPPVPVFTRRYRRYTTFHCTHGNESDRAGTEFKVGRLSERIVGRVNGDGGVVQIPYTQTGTIYARSIDKFNNTSAWTAVSYEDKMHSEYMDFTADQRGDFNDTARQPHYTPDFSTVNSSHIKNGVPTSTGIWLFLPTGYQAETSPLPNEFVVVEIWRDGRDINRFVNLYAKNQLNNEIRHVGTTSSNRAIIKLRLGEQALLHGVSAYANDEPSYSNILDVYNVGV